ncbi:MAG: nuclear transport factor 2 family protein [Thermomicrobiales bacterium]
MTTQLDQSLALVAAFHELLNARKPDELLELASEDIKIGGPRGSGVGKQLLNEWVGRASVTMHPQRTFARGGVVVVEQLADWHDATTGEVMSSQTVASVFRIADGKIVGIARHSHFAEAANKAGLDEDDEITS